MAARQHEARLVRTLRMLRAIASRRHGARVAELVDELGVSRASVYRYIADLEKGAGLVREQRNGEAWVRLPDEWGVRPGVAELFALVVARQVLAGLSGTKAQRWLEPRLRGAGAPLSVESSVPVEPEVARAVEAALGGERRRLTFGYRGFQSDTVTTRTVEPIELRFSQRAWYLFALDVDKREPRTFKLARMQQARVLPTPCTLSVAVDAEEAHAHSVHVWQTSEVHDVVVRLHPPWAAVAHEFPLQASQTITPDGADVIVRARVAGLEEVLRWVLRFGGDVTVVEPAALRERARREHERALQR
jgi:predicted DNA-binding transcriptional regulator YafY